MYQEVLKLGPKTATNRLGREQQKTNLNVPFRGTEIIRKFFCLHETANYELSYKTFLSKFILLAISLL